jgi:muramoyltetrapeptide carboxypeptidase
MAVTPRTRAGLIKFRPVRPGGRVALVAPASPFDREEFERGLKELRRLGFEPVFDDSVFDRQAIVAGSASRRAEAFLGAMTSDAIDAVVAVRGGYGSIELLPSLDAARLAGGRTAFIGYSDLTSMHAFLNGQAGLASVHGAMIEGRLARGPLAFDEASFTGSLGTTPLGELAPEGLEILRGGEAEGPIFGGTLTQIVSSLGTPFAFQAPAGSVLFLEDVAERPYRVRRALTQLRLSGVLARASALVFGQMPHCDEPIGEITTRDVVADLLEDFPGPVLFGFPSGHTTSAMVSLPFGVHARVVGHAPPRLVLEEAAAA